MSSVRNLEPVKKTLTEWLNSGIALLSWRAIMMIMGAIGLFVLCEAKNIGNNFVATTPAMLANTAAIAAAQEAVTEAKSRAADAKAQAKLVAESLDKLVDIIKASHEDIQSIKVVLASSQATTSANFQALGKQVDRLEAKADAK